MPFTPVPFSASTETLVYTRPELYVLVKKYPKYACPANPACGVASPERPTSLVEGERFDTSVAAAIVDAKWHLHMPIYRQQDVFAGSGWTPSRLTLLNIVTQVVFVVTPLVEYMKRLVQQDDAVGLDDTKCRMLLTATAPQALPDDPKSQRLAEKVAEAKAKGETSLLAKMWAYQGLVKAPYNIFDFRVSRHRDGPDPDRQQLGRAADDASRDGPQGVAVRVQRGGRRAERAADDAGEQCAASRPRRKDLP